MDYKDVIKYCNNNKINIGQYALQIEVKRGDFTAEQITDKFIKMLNVMKQSSSSAADKPLYSVSKISGGNAYKYNQYQQKGGSLLGKLAANAVTKALSTAETNAAMGKIVACPTAGSSGIVPAAILACGETFDLKQDLLIEALMASSLIGKIIAETASISGAEGGCQAESGSAAAMAAAAICQLRDGSPEVCFYAAAIAIKNSLGLVCDPVGGYVEIPCVKRNVGGVINALAAADMALAGIISYIPFDETVTAMSNIGKMLPSALKETSGGGLAATKTAAALSGKIFN